MASDSTDVGTDVEPEKQVDHEDREVRSQVYAPPPKRRRRITGFAFLAIGLVVAVYLSTQSPQEQHVNLVLGDQAPNVAGISLQYIAKDGEIARESHFSYEMGKAPRVVPHQLQLPNGDYRLQIDVDARDGRRSIPRQVTLGGGSTQIDISRAISKDP